MGNKTGYQHHGVWFARHGYVCLIIDTIQLGEIRGEHHGTYSKARWWWAGARLHAGRRGSLERDSRARLSRDAARKWIARSFGDHRALRRRRLLVVDRRARRADQGRRARPPGITTLKNHILDGAIEGHCDCMFMVNTERWDFDRVAALVAPRPLLIANTD